VQRGTRFLCAFRRTLGVVPPIGDSDSGNALSRFLRAGGEPDEDADHASHFQHSGYTAIQWAASPGTGFVFDHGSLGQPPSYGHGHADALSLILNVNGQPVLIDPGTYTYTGDQTGRKYFRGTPAHNTVTVDGRDQATQSGRFLWTKPFDCQLIAMEVRDAGSRGRLLAAHDGYRGAGIRHVRGVAWVLDQWLVVWDLLEGTAEHALELNWHLDREPLRLDDDRFQLHTARHAPMTMQCGGGPISTHVGERVPFRGWRSPTYGELKPGYTITIGFHGLLPHTFTTLIRASNIEPSNSDVETVLQWMQENAQ
jgi:hypothetical protein